MVTKKLNLIESTQKIHATRGKCMHTNFGGHSVFSFGDIATFKKAKFPFPTMDYIVPKKI